MGGGGGGGDRTEGGRVSRVQMTAYCLLLSFMCRNGKEMFKFFQRSDSFIIHTFLARPHGSRKLRHGSLVTYSKNEGGGQSSEDLAVTS